MDDPIFDPWSSGEDENEQKSSERGPRWRSASGSEGVPRSRPRPIGRPGEPRHHTPEGAPEAESADAVDLGDLAPDLAEPPQPPEHTQDTPRSAEERQVVWFLDDEDSLEAIAQDFGDELLDASQAGTAPAEDFGRGGPDRDTGAPPTLDTAELAPDSHPAPEAKDSHPDEPPPPRVRQSDSEPSWSSDPAPDPTTAEDPRWSPDPPPESHPLETTRPAAGERAAGPSVGGQPGREIGQDDPFGPADGAGEMAEKARRDRGPREAQPPDIGASERPADFWYRQIPPTRPEAPHGASEEVTSAPGIAQPKRRAELDAAVGVLRDALLPRVAELNQRLRLARHETTVDDRLSREHPSFRFRVVPWVGPFDEVDKHTGSALEIALDGRLGDTVSGSVWLDPLSEAPTQQRAVATKDLTGAWLEELLIDFVAEALGRS